MNGCCGFWGLPRQRRCFLVRGIFPSMLTAFGLHEWLLWVLGATSSTTTLSCRRNLPFVLTAFGLHEWSLWVLGVITSSATMLSRRRYASVHSTAFGLREWLLWVLGVIASSTTMLSRWRQFSIHVDRFRSFWMVVGPTGLPGLSVFTLPCHNHTKNAKS
jgi:hypothetical protein